MNNLFISIEGLDGSGKTTQMQNIRTYLERKGLNVALLREPGGTEIGEKIRDILLDVRNAEMDQVAEMMLYAASRAQMAAQKIIPLLEKGVTVVCDRYIDSSLAYQGYGRELNFEDVLKVNLIAIRNLLPHLTVFLDVDPETAIRRRQTVSETDRLERETVVFRKRVYQGYQELCRRFPERMISVNGNMVPEEITRCITSHIDRLIEGSKL